MTKTGRRHYSTRTNRWENCGATKRACRYTDHKPLDQLEDQSVAELIQAFSLTDFLDTARRPDELTGEAPVGATFKFERTGAFMNETYRLRSRLLDGYDPARVNPVQNIHELTFVKPNGGIWMSPERDGRNAWDELLGDFRGGIKHAVKFKPDARVLVINTREDYTRILERYPHRVDISGMTDEEFEFARLMPATSWHALDSDMIPRRGINYEALAKDYDGVYLTQRGLNECGKRDYMNTQYPGDISLSIWDIESGIVLNHEAVQLTAC